MLERLNRPSITLPWNVLVAIAGCLFFVHVTLDFQRGSYGHLSISLLFWMAIAALISDRRQELRLGSEPAAAVLGLMLLLGLIGVAIIKPRGIVLGFYPVVGAAGLGLMASGFRGLLQYRRELLGLLCLGLPKLVSLQTFDLSPATATFATLLMWYSGFPVQRQGVQIHLPPNGLLNVIPECSGLNLMLYMFGIAIVFLMLFPTTRRNNILFPILAIALGFILNGIRIALLTFLSAAANRQAFDYWHSEEGALFFVLLSVGLFGLLCWVLLGLGKHK
ncbi:MAG: cyanoexosortase A [Cyanobacteria bacterium P01_F01_bin.3]